MEHHSLNMQLPRGWYQVAGATPHTFRRHCLSSQSGSLQMSLLGPESSTMSGEEAQALLTETLVRQDIHVGMPLKTGCEECAAGIMAYAVYKHIGGQREYWIIPHEEATVFACWQMGAMTTAGMERQAIHQMLKQLHYEHTEDEEDEAAAEASGAVAAGEEEPQALAEEGAVAAEAEPRAEAEAEAAYPAGEYAEAEELYPAGQYEEGESSAAGEYAETEAPAAGEYEEAQPLAAGEHGQTHPHLAAEEPPQD